MKLKIIILAAGNGKRMATPLPKVLHRLAGKTLLERVVNTATQLNPDTILVVSGNGGHIVQNTLSFLPVTWVEQKEQLGTGHAVQQALPQLAADDRILILYGDVPLITAKTLNELLTKTPQNEVGLITSAFLDPSGFGRIIRDAKGNVKAIVEHKDANEAELHVNEINTGIITAPAHLLQHWLPKLQSHNTQGEYYLTDIIAMAAKDKIPVHAVIANDESEVQGVNTLQQLAKLERVYQCHYALGLMEQGVIIMDPSRFDVRGVLTAEPGAIIDINNIFEGQVHLGAGCVIESNCILHNVSLNNNVTVKANSIIEDAVIGEHCQIGPFARIRPKTQLADHVHIGNFVELKNATFNTGSKANHLSYVGDAVIGKKVNIGAGTITCNYDGANKHQTIIEDSAFIGSNSSLIAPVTIGENATIGAGSTINQDAPADTLTLARAKQRSINSWKRPKKKEKD